MRKRYLKVLIAIFIALNGCAYTSSDRKDSLVPRDHPPKFIYVRIDNSLFVHGQERSFTVFIKYENQARNLKSIQMEILDSTKLPVQGGIGEEIYLNTPNDFVVETSFNYIYKNPKLGDGTIRLRFVYYDSEILGPWEEITITVASGTNN